MTPGPCKSRPEGFFTAKKKAHNKGGKREKEAKREFGEKTKSPRRSKRGVCVGENIPTEKSAQRCKGKGESDRPTNRGFTPVEGKFQGKGLATQEKTKSAKKEKAIEIKNFRQVLKKVKKKKTGNVPPKLTQAARTSRTARKGRIKKKRGGGKRFRILSKKGGGIGEKEEKLIGPAR